MKTLVVALLVALLYAMRAQGLRCYKCYGKENLTTCEEETCAYHDGVCISQDITMLEEPKKSKIYSRFCLPKCPPDQDLVHSQPSTVKMTSKHFCCSQDLCNPLPEASTNRAPASLGGFLLSLGVALLTTPLC